MRYWGLGPQHLNFGVGGVHNPTPNRDLKTRTNRGNRGGNGGAVDFFFFFSDKESVPGRLKPAGRSDRIPSLSLRIVIFLKSQYLS